MKTIKFRDYQLNIGEVSNKEQFTGILDKNGKEIYEGDILSIYCPLHRGYLKGEVIYCDESLTYFIKFYHGASYFIVHLCYLQSDKKEMEIIGNIHDGVTKLDNNK